MTAFANGAAFLSQHELAYDWRAYVAKVQETAADLAGETTDVTWDKPPR